MQSLGYVVHVKTPGISGGETRSYQVAQALAAARSNVHLYGQIDDSFKWAHGVHPHQLKQPTPLGMAQLVRDFSHYRVRVVIERYHFPLFNVGFFAQQIRHNPTIFEIHGFPIDELVLLARNHSLPVDPLIKLIARLPRAVWTRLQATMFQRAAHFIVTSAGTKDILTKLSVPKERISVVYNCVDPVLFDPTGRDATACRVALNLPADGEIILYAGSLFHEELSLLVEAAPTVIAARPSARFVCIGVGPAAALADQARARNLSNQQFCVMPPVPHRRMPDLLAAADIVLAPYNLKSIRFAHIFHYSPLKVMEALAMHKSVVTVDAAELCTVFGHVPNVQFVKSGRWQSWAEGIIRALEMCGAPALAQGRTFIMDGYRWQDAAQKYLAVIRSVEQAPR